MTITNVVGVWQGAEDFGGGRTGQLSLQSEGGGAAPTSPSTFLQSRRGFAGPPSESVTQRLAAHLVAATTGTDQVEEHSSGQDMEQLDPLAPTTGGGVNAGVRAGRERHPSHASSLSSSSSEERLSGPSTSPRTFWERRAKTKPAVGAPDLVMDLPVTPLSSSPREQGGVSPRPRRVLRRGSPGYDSSSSSGGSSPRPTSPDMTGGEVFAKQSQSTLKKTPAPRPGSAPSSDAQTQTVVPLKVGLPSGLTPSRPDDTELHITEAEEAGGAGVSGVVRTLDTVVMQQQLDSEIRADRSVSGEGRVSGGEVRVEVRAAADRDGSVAATPSTPKLAARYLQAVAASTGAAPGIKPAVRVKPPVLKKPAINPASPEPEHSK